jgi:hypothetical protein
MVRGHRYNRAKKIPFVPDYSGTLDPKTERLVRDGVEYREQLPEN